MTILREDPKYVLHLPIEQHWTTCPELDLFAERLQRLSGAIQFHNIHRLAVRIGPEQLPHGLSLLHLLGMFRAALNQHYPLEFVPIDDPRGVDAVLI